MDSGPSGGASSPCRGSGRSRIRTHRTSHLCRLFISGRNFCQVYMRDSHQIEIQFFTDLHDCNTRRCDPRLSFCLRRSPAVLFFWMLIDASAQCQKQTYSKKKQKAFFTPCRHPRSLRSWDPYRTPPPLLYGRAVPLPWP